MALPPENYYKIGPYLGVFQGIHTALDINEGIIKVVGPDGAGKSSFCHKLVEELKAQGQEVIYFEQPPESQIISTNSSKAHLASIKARILIGH